MDWKFTICFEHKNLNESELTVHNRWIILRPKLHDYKETQVLSITGH